MPPEAWSSIYYAWYWLFFAAVCGIAVLLLRKLRRGNRFHLVFGNLCVLSVLLALLVVLGEGYFLFCYDETDTFGFVRISHRWMDRHVTRNSMGFRDDFDYRPRTNTNEFRIGVFGDSFAFGQGVRNPKDRFTDLLETGISESSNRDVVVFNLSDLGWDTDDHIKACGHLVPYLDLDVVILAYNMNDIRDLSPQNRELQQALANRPRWTHAIGKHSLFLDFVFARLMVFGQIQERGYGFLAKAYEDEAIMAEQAERIRSSIAASRRGDTQVYAVIFPMLGEPWGEYSLLDAHTALAGLFAEQNIECLDLLDELSQQDSSSLWVNDMDTHPNETAHRIAASAIHDKWFNTRGQKSAVRGQN